MATRRWVRRLRIPYQIAPVTGGEGVAPRRRDELSPPGGIARFTTLIRNPRVSTTYTARDVQVPLSAACGPGNALGAGRSYETECWLGPTAEVA